jgi:hypothetical protein
MRGRAAMVPRKAQLLLAQLGHLVRDGEVRRGEPPVHEQEIAEPDHRGQQADRERARLPRIARGHAGLLGFLGFLGFLALVGLLGRLGLGLDHELLFFVRGSGVMAPCTAGESSSSECCKDRDQLGGLGLRALQLHVPLLSAKRDR